MEKLPKSNHYNRDPHNQDFCVRTKDLPMQNSPYWSTESCLVCKEFGVSCASNIKWKISPLALRVSYCCVLKNCRHSHRQPCFPYDLFVAGRNNIHHPLPSVPSSHTQECDFSTIFSNFQTLLAAFFPHNRYILTNLATFLEKNLSYRSVGRCLQYCSASASYDSPGAVSPLSASVLSSERQRNSASSWPYRSRLVSKSFTKQHFQAPVAYWLFGLLNMNIIRLLICAFIVTQTQAVRWMRQNSNIAKTTAYSRFFSAS